MLERKILVCFVFVLWWRGVAPCFVLLLCNWHAVFSLTNYFVTIYSCILDGSLNYSVGSAGSQNAAPESRVTPVNHALKAKLMSTFCRSITAANSFPSTLQCIFGCIYGMGFLFQGHPLLCFWLEVVEINHYLFLLG